MQASGSDLRDLATVISPSTEKHHNAPLQAVQKIPWRFDRKSAYSLKSS